MWECPAWYECHWSNGWIIGLGANAVIALAYLAIALRIFQGVHRGGQWRSNPLARATGLIFFTCGVGHGIHAVHLLGPSVGIDLETGLAARVMYSEFHLFLWVPLTAMAAVLYWTLRSRFPALVRGAAMFEDLRERQRQALEIHDNVVQGLATAKLALETGKPDEALAQMDATLASARGIITDLLGEPGSEGALRAGELRRKEAAGAGPR